MEQPHLFLNISHCVWGEQSHCVWGRLAPPYIPPLIMDSAANDRDRGVPVAHLSSFLHSASPKLYSFLNPKSSPPSNPSRISHTSSSSVVEDVNFLEPVSESRSTGKGGGSGPAFLGQVFSMYKLSGAGLMDLSTQVDIPFLSKRYKCSTSP